MIAPVTELPVPRRVLAMAGRLTEIPGVVGVVLGGSRAIGTHRPDSDVDLGLYYRGSLDVAALRALAAETADEVLGMSEIGGWGPWVNGGAWLVVDGTRVDWIYRDLDRVAAIWSECRAGRYEIGVQAGHPLGYYSHVYPGEVALCQVLADPTGEVTRLRAEAQHYPAALADALVAATWEPDLLLYGASSHGAAAADAFFAAGCLFRAIGVLAQALHGHHRRWVTTEKRLIDAAGRLGAAPPDFARRAHAILGRTGTTTDEIAATVAAARALVADTIARLPVRPAPLPL
jgi:predicted nucleotidyltransferase